MSADPIAQIAPVDFLTLVGFVEVLCTGKYGQNDGQFGASPTAHPARPGAAVLPARCARVGGGVNLPVTKPR